MGQLVLLADTELKYTYTARMVLTQYQVDDMVTIGVKLCRVAIYNGSSLSTTHALGSLTIVHASHGTLHQPGDRGFESHSRKSSLKFPSTCKTCAYCTCSSSLHSG